MSFVEKFDSVVAPALPSGWTATNASGPAPLWVTSTASPDSAPNSAIVDDPAVISDKNLTAPGSLFLPLACRSASAISYNLERDITNFYDGGVLEV